MTEGQEPTPDSFSDRLNELLGESFINSVSPDPAPEFLVKKEVGYIQVSNELLMDMGVIPDTRAPAPPTPWRIRFRWWRAQKREDIAVWVYEKLSGGKFPDPYDY